MPYMKSRPEHTALRHGMLDYIEEHHPGLSGDEVLAVLANLLGHMLVAPDPGNDRPREMVDLVNANILMGQREARAALSKRTRH